MPSDELTPHGQHVMTVCNACRYCEQYCPVFPAIENRQTFATADLMYLANLCHNCGECLYACQYAPPHEFGINVPRTLAQLRLKSYEDYCWPRPLGALFRRNGVATSVLVTLALAGVMFAAAWWVHGGRLWQADPSADFYALIPHGVLVWLFGTVSAFVVLALAIAVRRFWRDIDTSGHTGKPGFMPLLTAFRDALSLRHLHAGGIDCTSAEEDRAPWRRFFHHCTFYGFLLCFASTSVAAAYHSLFGWEAPYGYASLPVVLGTVGGIGLVIGPAGLLALRRTRDRELGDPAQEGMDVSFITMLLLTSLTGLLLLVFRERAAMSALLIVHLGAVLALFVTLPYGKFVHGLYRVAALLKYARDDSMPAEGSLQPVRTPALAPSDYLVVPLRVRGEQPTK